MIGSATGAAIVFGLLWFLTSRMGWYSRTLWVFLTGAAVTAAGLGVLPFAIDFVNLVWDGGIRAAQGVARMAEGLG
jgi:hypothetical protein